MNRQHLAQGFPGLRECHCCGLLFANKHRCPAKDEKCSECNEYGHYSGFCLQWKTQPLPEAPNNTEEYRANVRNNLIGLTPLISSPFRRNMSDSLSKNNEDTQQEMKDNKIASHSHILDEDIQELMPKKKRFRGMDSNLRALENIQAVKIEPIENLMEELATGEAKKVELNKDKENSEVKLGAAEAKTAELQKSLDFEKKLVAKYHAKLNMYRNSALKKAHDKLTDQLKTCKEEAVQLTKQRNQLYDYVLKIQNHNAMVKQRVEDLVVEHKEIMTHLYKGYMDVDLPPWYRNCRHCGSHIAHHIEDCLARGNSCRNCGITNHFTAMCRKANLTLSVSSSEEKLMDSLGETNKEVNQKH